MMMSLSIRQFFHKLLLQVVTSLTTINELIFFKVKNLLFSSDDSMATRRSSRIRSVTPNANMNINSGSEDSQDANISKNVEKPKSGSKITSYFSPKQRAAAAASAASESDNSNVSQRYLFQFL